MTSEARHDRHEVLGDARRDGEGLGLPDLREVLGHLLRRRRALLGAHPPVRHAQEDPRVARPDLGVDLAGDGALTAGEVRDEGRRASRLGAVPDGGVRVEEARVLERARDRVVGQGLLGHLRDGVGHDGVDEHVAADRLERERVREADDAGLGGRVVDQALDAVGVRRGDVDDAAVALLAHDVPRGLGDVEHRPEVHGDRRLDRALRQVLEQPRAQDAGVVDQDVDPAELLDRVGHDAPGVLAVRDVVHGRDRPAAGVLDLRHDGIGPGAPREVVDHHRGATGGQLTSVLGTQPLPGARDDGDLAVQ